MTTDMAELKSKGMRCLIDQLGIIDAEAFIAVVIREQFDYTKWQQEYYDAMEPGEFMGKAYKYSAEKSYDGKGKEVLL